MKYRRVTLMAVLTLSSVFLLLGCEKEVQEVPPPPPQKVAAPAKAKAVQSAAVEAVPAEEPPPYRYTPVGRRDPFESLLIISDVETEVLVPLTPLQRFEIPQLRLIGVIVGKGEATAMVVAPDGKSYILKKGVKVGKQDGVVVAVTADAVLVEERYVDFTGEVRTGIQEIALPVREGVE